jgi:hypothetical protein
LVRNNKVVNLQLKRCGNGAALNPLTPTIMKAKFFISGYTKTADYRSFLSVLMRRAHELKKSKNIPFAEGMSLAWLCGKQVYKMQQGVVAFEFVKLGNGELRAAHGTLAQSLITYVPKGTGRKNNSILHVSYWDTDKESWRMFYLPNLVSVDFESFVSTDKFRSRENI